MLAALTVLLVYQLVGEVLVQLLHLPVPGPVIGMLLLFVTLLLRGEAPEALRNTANGLLSHLSLLFVPAGVGVMVHGARLAGEGLAILIAIVISTVLALAATALTVRALLREDRSTE